MHALYASGGKIRLVADYPRPELLPGEALIRVLRAGICNTDLELQQGYKGGFEGVPGHEFVGQVEGCAGQPELIGRRVVGEINLSCGVCQRCRQGMPTHCERRRVLGILNKDGAFAEYLTLPVENLHLVPDALSDAEAVFVEPLAACFEILEQVQIRPTSTALVLGDGKLGLLAAQVLRLTGAQVTLRGRHPEKLALARSLGIDAVHDDAAPHPAASDLVVECTGSAAGLELARQLVRPRGTIVLKSTVAQPAVIDLAPFVVDEITVVGSRCGPFEPALRALAHRQVNVAPLLGATYPLNQGVEAFARAAEHGMLKVQLEMARDGAMPQ
ncbi:MAG TPA: alcohol dehydrogenase catalytic domain-containing protein [Ktedonobacterales bacterium]|nr:alcohol dehydrogenase catalytic domain-containing protein [Ktedonobacterales bacterium]